MVYVLNIEGKPLMPCKEAKARKLLKQNKANILNGGIKKRNQAEYLVKGFRLFDKVEYDGQVGFIFGRRSSGYFDIRKLNGEVIHKSASYNKLKLLNTRKTLLLERRMQGLEYV